MSLSLPLAGAGIHRGGEKNHWALEQYDSGRAALRGGPTLHAAARLIVQQHVHFSRGNGLKTAAGPRWCGPRARPNVQGMSFCHPLWKGPQVQKQPQEGIIAQAGDAAIRRHRMLYTHPPAALPLDGTSAAACLKSLHSNMFQKMYLWSCPYSNAD
jgi:hypothetical protein